MIVSCMVPLALQQSKSMQGQVQSFLSGMTDLSSMLQLGESLRHRLPMLCHLHMRFSCTSHQMIAAHKLSAWTPAALGISAYMGSDWNFAQWQQYLTKLL